MKNGFRVGIVGSHNTGKTTLMQAVQRIPFNNGYPYAIRGIINSCSFQAETVRVMAEQYGIQPNENSPIMHQTAILHYSCVTPLLNQWLVSDRCPIDNYAYYTYILDHNKPPLHAPEVERYYEDMVFYIADMYDILIFCDVLFPLEDDGFRSMADEFQQDIHKRIEKYLGRLHHPAIIRTSDHKHIDKHHTTINMDTLLQEFSQKISTFL